MCCSNMFSMQCQFDIGVYDSLANLSFPCFNMGKILETFKMSGNFPSIRDLFIAKVMCGAHALGHIFMNFILVRLNPLADEFLDFCIIISTLSTDMYGMLNLD